MMKSHSFLLFARPDIPCPDTEQYLIFTKPSQVLFSIGYLLIFLVSTQSTHISLFWEISQQLLSQNGCVFMSKIK